MKWPFDLELLPINFYNLTILDFQALPFFNVFRLINDSANLTGVWQIMSIDCNRNSGLIQNAHICLREKWEKRTLFQTHQREYIEHYIRKPEGVCMRLARHNKRNGKSNRTFKNKTFFSANLIIRYFIDDHLHQCLVRERLVVNSAKRRIDCVEADQFKCHFLV